MDGMNIAEVPREPKKGLKEGVVREDFSGEGYFPGWQHRNLAERRTAAYHCLHCGLSQTRGKLMFSRILGC